MKKIILLAMFSGMLIYGQAQIISAIVNEKDHNTGIAQVKLYSSPFRDVWPGMIIGDPEVPTAVQRSGCAWITENDTMTLLSTSDYQVVLWKNGELIDISGEELGVGASLFIHGNDTYVLWNKLYPYPYYTSYIWKNGETYCEIVNREWSVANSIFVSDSNIYVVGASGYVAGSIAGSQGSSHATLWINGVAQFLSDTLYNSNATSIVVSDGNVYIAGYRKEYGVAKATTWINETETNLANEYITDVNSIYVDGENVYVVGYEMIGYLYRPVLWINGVMHQLSTQMGTAVCLRIFEGNIYIGGILNDIATIWKNGTPMDEFTELYSNGVVADLFIFPDTTSKVNDFEQPLFNATLYPNPATHHVTIDMPSGIPSAQFSLFDIYGRLLLQEQIQNGERINLPNLASGVYLYQVDSGKGRVTGKVMVSYK